MTFYDRWLGMWDDSKADKKAARKVIHEEELAWVETAQDHRAALLIAPETGFRTMGTLTMLAEIPPGSHSGEHKHGEEAIYIVAGEGSSIIDGVRYDWSAGSTLAIPFGARHQHYNTGDVTVRYFSVLSVHLEQFAGLHRTVQYQPRGSGKVPDAPASVDGLEVSGRRIHLAGGAIPANDSKTGQDVAADTHAEPSAEERAFLAGETLNVGDIEGFHRFIHLHRDDANVEKIMRIGRDVNGFAVAEQEISGILRDPAAHYSGKHAHQEALLYVLSGSGHTVIENEAVPWKPGSAIHVCGPQTVHQHFVESETDSRMIRVSSGLRYFFEPIVKAEWPYLFISPRQKVVESVSAETAK